MTHFLKLKKMLGLSSYSTVYKWVKRINPVSINTAKRLEKITGIDRRRFCWPDDFGDPWHDVKRVLDQTDL